MAIQYRKKALVLQYLENKPTVYKLHQLRYPAITEEDLVKYAANAAAVPPSTMQACAEAIAQAIIYYAINGMRVVIPNFGGFYLAFRSKTVKNAEDLDDKAIKFTGLAFQPLSAIRNLVTDTGETVVDAVYNEQAPVVNP